MSNQIQKCLSPDALFDSWNERHFPPVSEDREWYKLKWHICKPGEALNPILFSKGGEIEVEQFGIIGWLWRVQDKTFKNKKRYFYQCPLIQARRSGTGKFGEWLKNVKEFVWKEFKAPLALANITNQHLYKYCEKYNVPVAVDYRLYKVKTQRPTK